MTKREILQNVRAENDGVQEAWRWVMRVGGRQLGDWRGQRE